MTYEAMSYAKLLRRTVFSSSLYFLVSIQASHFFVFGKIMHDVTY